MLLTIDVLKIDFLVVDVIELDVLKIDFLVVDVIELDVLGARHH
jgi:hypothetical protein